MKVSVTPILISNEDLPPEARTAIAEGRLEDAGRILMEAYDLSCEEATELVNRVLCP